MARTVRTVIDVIDDLTGDPIDEKDAITVPFSYRGKDYEIDLGPANAKQLEEALEPFIAAARRAPATRKTTAGKSAAGTPRRNRSDEPKKIREWAAEQGHQVPPRGRIPDEIVAAYRARQPAPTPTDKGVEAASEPAGTL